MIGGKLLGGTCAKRVRRKGKKRNGRGGEVDG